MIGDFHDGFAVGIARGRRFNEAIRGELEFSFRNFDAENWNVGGIVSDWDGDLNAYFGMANLYRDCVNSEFRGFTPYIGGGIGFAIIDGEFDTPAIRLEIEDSAFAYQAIAGLTKRLSNVVDGFVEYRFVGTTEVDLVRTNPAPEQEFGDYEGHFNNVLFGLRIWR